MVLPVSFAVAHYCWDAHTHQDDGEGGDDSEDALATIY